MMDIVFQQLNLRELVHVKVAFGEQKKILFVNIPSFICFVELNVVTLFVATKLCVNVVDALFVAVV